MKTYCGSLFRNKIMSLLFSIFLFSIIISTLVSATVIGSSKSSLNYDNVLKGGYSQQVVTLTTDSDFNISITYKLEGDLAPWMTVESYDGPMIVNREKPLILTVIIQPPFDAKIDSYSGTVRFITSPLAGPEGQFGTAVRTAIQLGANARLTGQQILECNNVDTTIDDVEEGYPIEFYTVFENNGNVRLNPDFSLEFWNQDQTKLVQTLNFSAEEYILPTVQKRIFKQLKHNLPIGQYWVRISTPTCAPKGGGFLTMSVLERGGISDKGQLLEIKNTPDVRVGEIVPIDAVFINQGTRVVSAKFKGVITSGSKDNIFKVIDTEPIDVDPGKTEFLRTYFNPTQEGQYFITGRVLYNRKLTFEKESVLNVVSSQGSGVQSTLHNPLVLVLIFFATFTIVLLIIIIRKRKEEK